MNQELEELLKKKEPVLLSGTDIIVWNLCENYNASVVLDTNKKLFFEKLEKGDYGVLKIVQGVGGNHTLELPSNSKVSSNGLGALGLSASAGAVDIATFYYDGINLFWNLSLNFS